MLSKVGTVRYMAPEVLDRSLNLSIKDHVLSTDIYSFGVIMWELLYRCDGESTTKTMFQF